jgi:DHA2 family multidrug resistance protein
LRLNERLDALNPNLSQAIQQGQTYFLRQTGDPVLSRRMTLDAIQQLRAQQALSLSYFDVFWVCAVVAAGMILLVLLMRRSVAEKGAHISAE